MELFFSPRNSESVIDPPKKPSENWDPGFQMLKATDTSNVQKEHNFEAIFAAQLQCVLIHTGKLKAVSSDASAFSEKVSKKALSKFLSF